MPFYPLLYPEVTGDFSINAHQVRGIPCGYSMAVKQSTLFAFVSSEPSTSGVSSQKKNGELNVDFIPTVHPPNRNTHLFVMCLLAFFYLGRCGMFGNRIRQ